MKRVTASEGCKNWFRLIDEVARGEEICVERHGKKIVLRAEEEGKAGDSGIPEYRGLVQLVGSVDADRWGWEWPGPEGEMTPRLLNPRREGS